MRNELIYIVFLTVLLVSCEEYYKPDLEVVPGLLVVESHLTNDPNQNYVKLTKSRDFYSVESAEGIKGATVELIERGIASFTGKELSTGYFTFGSTPVIGKKYKLRITWENDAYESDEVIMPPLPTIDTLYTNHKTVKSFITDAYGVPEQVEISGRNICIDAPIRPTLEYYRFSWRSIIQWAYIPVPPPGVMFPPPPIYGWNSRFDNGNFNIAGPKEFSVSDRVKNHPILFLGYDNRAYLDSSTQVFMGWIIIIDQYGISKESYDFHDKLNKQFSAEGSLFDPVLTQVFGNIHCKTDPEKIAVGFFDLNSYRQYRYFIYLSGQDSKVYQHRINRHLDIPGSGSVEGAPPEFWENIY
jgi:hypothetical protein